MSGKIKADTVFPDNSYLNLFQFFIHSDLGKIIQYIVKEFKKHPPQFVAVRYVFCRTLYLGVNFTFQFFVCRQRDIF